VLPTATDPKLIDAGATEMSAAPGVVCWPDPGFEALVKPMQPEVKTVAQIRSARETGKIGLLHAGAVGVACFAAPEKYFIAEKLFISAILVCGTKWDYCPNGHLWDRGENLHLTGRCGRRWRAAK
jgi:hypothetical protein